MAKFQSMLQHFTLFFLALIVFNYSLQSHARLLKPLDQDNVPASTSEKKIDSSMNSHNEDSSENHTYAFQPTTPGNSPGVGHRYFTEEKSKKTVVQRPDDNISVTEDTKNDFKKTDPGHSPGVGHAYQNKIGN
ncbi:unnamed protein product [Lathyrus oleraceus]|uniref:precursor of CEP7 n=1 Tax=Pisum sativum TaxID=3888 RepID=UPI0021D0137A|nr:precursor of CEP7-like [Pisum sativum]